MMKRLFFPLFAGLLWLMSGTLSATERTYNVLFIQSYTKNTPWHSLLTENLENGLDKGVVVIKDGKAVAKSVGYRPKSEITAMVEGAR